MPRATRVSPYSLTLTFLERRRLTSGCPLGGSVAKLLLQHPNEYKVRAVTRNPSSDAAKALQSKGAEVVQSDMTVPSSLRPALEGCWGVFGVTNFYDGIRLLAKLG